MIPPPNVTGSLHMGHGFQNTLMDIMTRLKRMQQYDVLWQVGTDHAGIATQLVVERKLEGEGKTRESLGEVSLRKKSGNGKSTLAIPLPSNLEDWFFSGLVF